MEGEPQRRSDGTAADPRVEVARITRSGAITAAVITGVLAVVAAAVPAYFFGHEQGEAAASAPTVTVTATVQGPPPSSGGSSGGSKASASASAAASSSGKAWTDVQALFTAKDGTKTPMPASTVRFCVSTGTGIRLNDSQDVPFEKITRIDVTHSDVALSPGGLAKLHVTLVAGDPLDGTITSGCDFFGQSDIGRYSLYPDRLSSIEFKR